MVSKPNATSLQLNNLRNTANSAYLLNSVAGTNFASAAQVTPGGLQGPQGPQGLRGPTGPAGGDTGEVTIPGLTFTDGLETKFLLSLGNPGSTSAAFELTIVGHYNSTNPSGSFTREGYSYKVKGLITGKSTTAQSGAISVVLGTPEALNTNLLAPAPSIAYVDNGPWEAYVYVTGVADKRIDWSGLAKMLYIE